MGPWDRATTGPLDPLHSTVPKFHIDLLARTRLNVHDDDLCYCKDHEPQGESDTRFSTEF